MHTPAMRCFYYRILLDDGRTRMGISKLAMVQTSSAHIYLEQHWSAVVLSLKALPRWFNGVFDAFRVLTHGHLNQADLAEFFRNLSVMLSGGVPILEAMDELATDEGKHTPSTMLASDLHDHLSSGSSLTESLDYHADIVPESVRNLASIGEASGTLDITMAHAAEHLSRVLHITQDGKRALIYPSFVFVVSIAVALFWVYYVVPNISDLFRQMQVELPWLTVAVVAFSNYVHDNFLLFVSVLAGLVLSIILLVKYNSRARYVMHLLAYYLPVSRMLVRPSSLAFIAEYLSLLLAAGVDIIQSLDVLQRAIGNEVYRRKISQVRENVMLGNSLSEAMRETGIFSGFMLRMISVGEQTGTLDQQLAYLAGEYRRRLEHVVATIGEIIQPVVMSLVGGMFILMVLALFLPIYQLIGQMGVLR